MDRVDERRGQGLVIGVGPLWLRHYLSDVFAEEDEVVLDVLLAHDPLAVDDLRLWLFRLSSSFFLTLRLVSCGILLSRAILLLLFVVLSGGLRCIVRLPHDDG